MSTNKELDLKYIKEFGKIKISTICKELGIYKSNLWRGNASEEAVKKVRLELEKRLKQLNENTHKND